MKPILDRLDEQCNGFPARTQELYGAMVERGPKFVDDWMLFSDQMIEKLETATIDEYDEWRISIGRIPLFKSIMHKGKESLLQKLRIQRDVDIAAYHLYMEQIT